MNAGILLPLLAISVGLFAVLGKGWFRPWLELQHRRMDAEAERLTRIEARDAAKIERLEARVAVLERILTDRSASLAAEIDRLRDSPLN